MLVKDYMTRHPIMVEPGRRVVDAQRLMAESKVGHLPVVADGKRLLGMVSRAALSLRPEQLEGLSFWDLTDYMARLTVGRVMTPLSDIHTISPSSTLEEAADLMIAGHVTALPVVEDGGVVVGIITQTDLLVELRNLLGAIEPGWRVVVRMPDIQGEFGKVMQVITARGWGVMAMGCVRSPRRAELWDVVLKVRYCERDELVAELKKIPGQEIIDIRETTSYTQ
ncbi:CBS domain-containing protein [Oscillochloris sp. ZM17-4]|uniref:CBS domain-containing protein n=1 Tax=Oscillochloris sp. ZM17-4 TaxID=2866714 RepID=UPI001C732E37|nr:CBS domain-containing protein [Oscillochloris sp. ZM17-4]MBX0328901.1 CBS domain-containing protein [Oscillochloris sp. ZM17-4]